MAKMMESLLWTIAAVAIIFYGSGQHDLITLLRSDSRVNRVFLSLGVINIFLNAFFFLCVYVWLGYVKGHRDPVRSDTLAVPAGAVTFSTTIISFIVALWPVFGILAILQVVVVLFGVMSALSFIPGIGPLAVRSSSKHKDT